MDTAWMITEFDLTKLTFRPRTSVRETAIRAIGIAVVIFVVITIGSKAYWEQWFGWAGPWLAGLIIFTCATVGVASMIDQLMDERGWRATGSLCG